MAQEDEVIRVECQKCNYAVSGIDAFSLDAKMDKHEREAHPDEDSDDFEPPTVNNEVI